MAGPAASDVRLPDDSSNTGKRIRTQTRVVGGNTVHEHYFVQASTRVILGRYYFATTLQSVQASAHNGTTTAFFWLQMPTGSQRGRLKRLRVEHVSIATSSVDMPTAPRIALARFTFTGTASGTSITACLRRSDDAAATAVVRTASTGMTVTLGAIAYSTIAIPIDVATSGMVYPFGVSEFQPSDEEDYLDFDAGQGFVLYQPDAGTTSDTRRFIVSGEWDEYDDT